eukprot:scaffold202_cov180-Amphora_coffeaeformis.AAC.7
MAAPLPLTFALIPKGLSCVDDEFFESIWRGCQGRAAEITGRVVRCTCVPRASDQVTQGLVIRDILANNSNSNSITDTTNTTSYRYNGIAVAVRDADNVQDPIAEAAAAGLPVVTVDSDAPKSSRLAYIGTDNMAMGRELGRLLLQLRPQGGSYVMVSAQSPHLEEREQGIREALDSTLWKEAAMGPLYTSNPVEIATLVQEQPGINGVISTFLAPMGNATAWMKYLGLHRDNITFVGADWTDGQLQLLRDGFAHGLVGQLPYEMGRQVVSTLVKWHDFKDDVAIVDPNGQVESVVFGTNLVDMLRVPLNLPPIDFNYNYLNQVVIFGYTSFGLIALLSIGAAVWTYVNRTKYVVKASQPIFLYIICFGTLVFASSIIIMGLDDENHSNATLDRACTSLPWLYNIGFVLIFSALFSKTWRINRLFHQSNKFKRIKVTTKDVILPLVLLLVANFIILVCWTLFDPIHYKRIPSSSTDLWNRVVSSHGMCRMPEERTPLPYMILLGCVNGGALMFAMYQAYRARDIQTEFAESKYIAIAFASLAEAALVGLPVLILNRDNSLVTYVQTTIFCALLCLAILGLIFVPKIVHQRNYDAAQAEKKEKKRIHVTGLDPRAQPVPLDSSDHADKESGDAGMKVYFWKKISNSTLHRHDSQSYHYDNRSRNFGDGSMRHEHHRNTSDGPMIHPVAEGGDPDGARDVDTTNGHQESQT